MLFRSTPFDCIALGENSLLRADPSVSCLDAAWPVLGALGGLGTAVYSLGFPLLCWRVTRAATRATRASDAVEASETKEPPQADDERSRVVARRSARALLLMRSYREEFWYWESLELLRKYFLTSMVLVLAHDTLLQVYLGLMACVFFALLVEIGRAHV